MSEEWSDEQRAYSERAGQVVLPSGLRFKAVWTPQEGLVSEGEVRTRLRPQGDATHTYVHLEDDDGTQYTIEVRPLIGRPEVTLEWAGPTS